MESRLSTPGPAVSKSTAGLESVVARMMVLRILSGGSSSATAWLAAGFGFAHLLRGVVQPHDARAHRRQAGVGHHERVAVERIEALGDVAGQFQVLRLVLAHRHDAGLVEQDVGRHQHGVLQQAVADGFLLGGLGLVLRHALQPADRRDAGEHPGELGVRGHGGLHHDGADLGIDAGGQVERGDLLDLGAQLARAPGRR